MNNKNNQCTVCFKTFKHNYLLQRHYRRKSKCKSPTRSANEIEKQIEELNNDLVETKKRVHELEQANTNKHDILNDDGTGYRCKYCRKSFTFQKSLQRHYNNGSCTEKNDNIAIYERELGIVVTPPKTDLTCRFCNTSFSTQPGYSRHMSSTCKPRYKYELELQARVLTNRKAAASTVNNNTVININIPELRPFGRENHDYITTKTLLKELHNCTNVQHMTSIVNKFTKFIYANPAHPENHTVLFKSLNSGYARVYNGIEFEDRQSVEVQDEILQNIGSIVTNRCDQYYRENTKINQNKLLADTKTEVMEMLDDLDNDIINDVSKDIDEDNNTRKLKSYRNTIKSAIHSSKDEIETTQSLIT